MLLATIATFNTELGMCFWKIWVEFEVEFKWVKIHKIHVIFNKTNFAKLIALFGNYYILKVL